MTVGGNTLNWEEEKAGVARGRIKLNRELMVRLSAALGDQRQSQAVAQASAGGQQTLSVAHFCQMLEDEHSLPEEVRLAKEEVVGGGLPAKRRRRMLAAKLSGATEQQTAEAISTTSGSLAFGGEDFVEENSTKPQTLMTERIEKESVLNYNDDATNERNSCSSESCSFSGSQENNKYSTSGKLRVCRNSLNGGRDNRRQLEVGSCIGSHHCYPFAGRRHRRDCCTVGSKRPLVVEEAPAAHVNRSRLSGAMSGAGGPNFHLLFLRNKETGSSYWPSPNRKQQQQQQRGQFKQLERRRKEGQLRRRRRSCWLMVGCHQNHKGFKTKKLTRGKLQLERGSCSTSCHRQWKVHHLRSKSSKPLRAKFWLHRGRHSSLTLSGCRLCPQVGLQKAKQLQEGIVYSLSGLQVMTAAQMLSATSLAAQSTKPASKNRKRASSKLVATLVEEANLKQNKTNDNDEEEEEEKGGSKFNKKPTVIKKLQEQARTGSIQPNASLPFLSCSAKQQDGQLEATRLADNKPKNIPERLTPICLVVKQQQQQRCETVTRTKRQQQQETCSLARTRCDRHKEEEEVARCPAAIGRELKPKLNQSSVSGVSWTLLYWLVSIVLSLALLNQRVLPVSGHQLSSGGDGGSDELSRAVLATMSTQSPPGGRQRSGDELATSLVPTNMSNPPANSVPNRNGLNVYDGTRPLGLGLDDEQQQQQQSAATNTMEQPDVFERLLQFCRIFVMSAIIVGDICGNSLVILSVCRHSKLRVTTNWFVVSLACADILVALFAMTFNASVIISGRWLFKPWVCDFWNSCDVLASTASILHLCCISIDRYIAIMRPLDYPMKITTRRVVYALCGVWISSALLSYIPIFTGVYTTAEHIKWLKDNPDQCEFVVNRVYAIVSSSISFWIPCCIMVFTYYRIYREATRQEKFIYKAQSMMPAPMPNHCHNSNNNSNKSAHGGRSKQRRSKSVAVPTGSGGVRLAGRNLPPHQQQHQLKPANSGAIATTNLNSSGSIQAISQATTKQQQQLQLTGSAQPTEGDGRAVSMLQLGAAAAEAEPLASATAGSATNNQRAMVAFEEKPVRVEEEEEEDDDDPMDDSNSGQSTPTKRSISKMKREHKAAKTLGIIMGVFILCWLPFFSWYTPQHICGHACDGIVPRGAVTILFWIGYFNSTLNPIIYAYFNHEFRDAFKKTLQWIFCCCQDLKCLRVNRPNDNQHYNCTYRSTQEIGLVSNS